MTTCELEFSQSDLQQRERLQVALLQRHRRWLAPLQQHVSEWVNWNLQVRHDRTETLNQFASGALRCCIVETQPEHLQQDLLFICQLTRSIQQQLPGCYQPMIAAHPDLRQDGYRGWQVAFHAAGAICFDDFQQPRPLIRCVNQIAATMPVRTLSFSEYVWAHLPWPHSTPK